MFTIIGIDMTAWTPETIKALRKSTGLTQRAFALRIGTTREYVNKLEKGVRTPSVMLCILLDYIRKETTQGKESD